MLTIALPNGSLQQKTLELFHRAGINIPDPTRQHWVEVGHELVKTIVWMRAQHVIDAILDGMVDVGITGVDCSWEWRCANRNRERYSAVAIAKLSYSKKTNKPDQIVLIAGKDEMAESPSRGERVFTEFPNWTSLLLGNLKIKAVPAFGSVEAFIPRRYRFGVTVSETGESLKINGLKVVRVLAESSPTLFAGPSISTKWSLFHELAEKLTQKGAKTCQLPESSRSG